MRHPRNKRQHQGSTLPICLILTGILNILAINALRSATTEARLGISAQDFSRAFHLAERGVVTALAFARTQPENLPLSLPVTIPITQPTLPDHSIDITIKATGNDGHCPLFTVGERQHYEIYATGIAGMGATRTHIQGFYICRELCTGENCINAEAAPIPSYWTVFGDA
ncbi:MAG: hypothetical protein GY746_14635 [Gammaproteobacteria bacterium]|nr:hypothetical protein [Gammaproteobacteria bacterium]MCP4927695.1 hypothetical protein [Gammaproteobacteria bacterium]